MESKLFKREVSVHFDKKYAKTVSFDLWQDSKIWLIFLLFCLMVIVFKYFNLISTFSYPFMFIPVFFIVLVVPMTYFKTWKNWRVFSDKGPVQYTITDDSISWTHPMFTMTGVSWDLCKRIRKTKNVIYIYQASNVPFVMLPRNLVDQELEDFLTRKMNS